MISVVVPAYNAAGTISACISALENQTIPRDHYEIIVVDDGSTDKTASIVKATQARLVCPGKVGKSGVRNAGAAAARGDILLFTDADCEPRSDWIACMIKPLQSDPEVVGVKGAYLSRQKNLVARFTQVEVEERYDRMRRQPHINFIDTYAAAYRRDIFLENGGFDTNLPEVEDQDFSFRLAAKGYKMVFAPEARVWHRHLTSPTRYFTRKFAIGKWKAMLMHRHPERILSDSRTPQTLKIQMVTVLLLGPTLVAALVWRPFAWAALALLLAFIATCLPFLVKTVKQDSPVLLIALPMLLLRAAALIYGYVYGAFSLARIARQQRPILAGHHRFFKRTLDLLLSGALLMASLPILPAIALAIKLTSPGPVLFRQKRVGQGGELFTVYKFRSMTMNAEAELDQLIDLDRLPEPVFKLVDDPRITPVGKFLRRWSLDEIPQFWNVIKGEMSLVGPRPEELHIVNRYSDWHRRRLAIKPGVTGPMQVNGRADLPLDARVQLELDYIEHYSPWRDVVILAQTIPAVIKGTGAR